ncbi:MAG TPA: TetR/AcrR family transcriptional regulator [Solirubrobacterales bacterium]
MQKAKAPRPYRMGERAASTEATREGIIEAALQLSVDRSYEEITLRGIAAAAGVSLQTVVNHFGSKEGLVAAALASGLGHAKFLGGREKAPVGDIGRAVRLLADDYELGGDAVIRMLALEDRLPAVKAILDEGRVAHREWVERIFPVPLAGLKGRRRARRVDLLACVTDVYTWKLLRRDRQLSQAETVAAIRELVEALVR